MVNEEDEVHRAHCEEDDIGRRRYQRIHGIDPMQELGSTLMPFLSTHRAVDMHVYKQTLSAQLEEGRKHNAVLIDAKKSISEVFRDGVEKMTIASTRRKRDSGS